MLIKYLYDVLKFLKYDEIKRYKQSEWQNGSGVVWNTSNTFTTNYHQQIPRCWVKIWRYNDMEKNERKKNTKTLDGIRNKITHLSLSVPCFQLNPHLLKRK